MDETPRYYSEFGEDRWIAENLWLPRWGVYVDLGCAHRSNTAFLRDRGWSGVVVDGNRDQWQHWGPEMAAHCQFVHAVVSPQKEAGFLVHENSSWSRIDPAAPVVPCRTAEDIFQEYGVGRIDFLSIDLEGGEYDAFLTFDLEKHQPSIIVAEYNTAGSGEDWRLHKHLLKTKRYELVHKNGSNHIFQRLTKS